MYVISRLRHGLDHFFFLFLLYSKLWAFVLYRYITLSFSTTAYPECTVIRCRFISETRSHLCVSPVLLIFLPFLRNRVARCCPHVAHCGVLFVLLVACQRVNVGFALLSPPPSSDPKIGVYMLNSGVKQLFVKVSAQIKRTWFSNMAKSSGLIMSVRIISPFTLAECLQLLHDQNLAEPHLAFVRTCEVQFKEIIRHFLTNKVHFVLRMLMQSLSFFFIRIGRSFWFGFYLFIYLFICLSQFHLRPPLFIPQLATLV